MEISFLQPSKSLGNNLVDHGVNSGYEVAAASGTSVMKRVETK
ncbi:hypothetical protein [Pseudomonas sp. GM102]|nr:hypothetical protein [Pseudomonas sp. GM102]